MSDEVLRQLVLTKLPRDRFPDAWRLTEEACGIHHFFDLLEARSSSNFGTAGQRGPTVAAAVDEQPTSTEEIVAAVLSRLRIKGKGKPFHGKKTKKSGVSERDR